MRHILAYDLGTSGVKASLYDESGHLLAARYGQYPTLYPGQGMREQRPAQWWDCIKKATQEMTAEYRPEKIAAIGVSGHSLGVIAVDDDGNLLTDTTPIWSDARAKAQADAFFDRTDYRKWYEATGNGFPRYLYALFKMMWIKERMPDVYEKTVCFLGTKDYINYKLTGEMCTDRSYASGSGAYDLLREEYREEYLELAGIERGRLPGVKDSAQVIGTVTKQAADELGVCSGIPVVAGGVDNACMTLGADCRHVGDAYASLGTSAWVTVCTEKPSSNFEARIYTFAHCIPGQYIPSVGIFSSGSSLEWMIHQMHLGTTQGAEVYDVLSEMVRETPAGANGLLFIPNLAGGSSYDPSPDVRGLLAGLDLKHTEKDVARAVYEGIAMHLRYAYDILAPEAVISEKLLLVGGGARSDVWRSIYASVFGKPVCRTAVVQDAASLGAAALAAVGTGIWKDYTPLTKAHGKGCITWPDPEEMQVYEKLLPKYKDICALTQNIAVRMKE